MEKTTTISRKELMHIIGEVTKELEKIIARSTSDMYERTYEGETIFISTEDQVIKWTLWKPKKDDENEFAMKAMSSDDYQPSHSFGSMADKGLLIGMSWIKANDTFGHKISGKVVPIIIVGSKAENKETLLRTNLKWYEHLHPSVIRMKRLMYFARNKRVRSKSIAIEHDLAKIVPNRLDEILLGDNDGKKN